MDEATATARLQSMTAHDVDPTLSEAEITALLKQFARPDAFGALPSDVDYVPTWDLNGAAAQGWLNKSAKCSNRFAFSSDVNSFDRNQVFDHCMKMHERYARRAAQSLTIGNSGNIDPVIGNLG